jgi:DNA replication protein DnaC
MLNHPTHEKLNQLKLFGMARALVEHGALDLDHLGFEERLGMLVDREVTERDGRLLAQRLLRAKLKPNTAAEDTDYRHARGLDKVLDDRHNARSTVVTSQLPVEHWHAAIGDATLADAILDRLVHNAHQLTLKGESLRKKRTRLTDQLVQE